MAFADPARVSGRMGFADERTTAKKRGPLDAALLSSKLEAHLREQEASRLRREKRDAVRNGQYVPRAAAKSFTVTSTPIQDVVRPRNQAAACRKPRSPSSTLVAEPLSIDGEVRVPPKQLYASLNYGVAEHELGPVNAVVPTNTETLYQPEKCWRGERVPNDVASEEQSAIPAVTRYGPITDDDNNIVRVDPGQSHQRVYNNPEKRRSVKSEKRNSLELERKRQSIRSEKHQAVDADPKHDSMNPTSREGLSAVASGAVSPLRRRPSPPPQPRMRPQISVPALPSAMEHRMQYRPGDAAKRRSIVGLAQVAHIERRSEERHGSMELYNSRNTDRRMSKFIESDGFLINPVIPESEASPRTQRPRLVPHDRPDWSQASQTGDDAHFTLYFRPRHTKTAPEQRERPRSVMHERSGNTLASLPDAGSKHAAARKHSAPEHGHLIADAVKIIQREQKLRRRDSIFGFFKRS